jgi:hypothetical protein
LNGLTELVFLNKESPKVVLLRSNLVSFFKLNGLKDSFLLSDFSSVDENTVDLKISFAYLALSELLKVSEKSKFVSPPKILSLPFNLSALS